MLLVTGYCAEKEVALFTFAKKTIMAKPSIAELESHMPQTGSVAWIGIRPGVRQPLIAVEKVEAVAGTGLRGDHYDNPGGKRQLTLIQGEHLDAAASILSQSEIDPGLTRRNIVVRGINLQALKERRFSIGEVVIEATGDCVPCSRMEENLGTGGYNAMCGHGGITARIVSSGHISVGDEVKLLPQNA